MKYVLGFGLLCKKYKKFPTIKLFVNDYLIDEFAINDTTKLLVKEINYTKWLGISKEGVKDFVKLAKEIALIKDPPAEMPGAFKNKIAKLPPIIQNNINEKDAKILGEDVVNYSFKEGLNSATNATGILNPIWGLELLTHKCFDVSKIVQD